MWSSKKPNKPPPVEPGPTNLQANHAPRPARSSFEETTTMNKDVMRPFGATADPARPWLGSSLQVKGEIPGNEDLLIDGSVEGQVQVDDRNLTVGKTAKVSADIIAREVVIYGEVKGNVRAAGSRSRKRVR
jgi:hypothetical protein